jgi:hypothetical protein
VTFSVKYVRCIPPPRSMRIAIGRHRELTLTFSRCSSGSRPVGDSGRAAAARPPAIPVRIVRGSRHPDTATLRCAMGWALNQSSSTRGWRLWISGAPVRAVALDPRLGLPGLQEGCLDFKRRPGDLLLASDTITARLLSRGRTGRSRRPQRTWGGGIAIELLLDDLGYPLSTPRRPGTPRHRRGAGRSQLEHRGRRHPALCTARVSAISAQAKAQPTMRS